MLSALIAGHPAIRLAGTRRIARRRARARAVRVLIHVYIYIASVITKACDPASHPKAIDDYNPWNAPGPKRDFILSLGFALQRANSRMLRNADRRRRLARMSGKYSSGTHPLSSDDDY